MFDVAIIGGGPAGLSAALTLGRARRSVLLCDAGRGRNDRADAVHGFLGHDGTSPDDLRRIGREQLRRYPSVEVRDAAVTKVVGEKGRFTLAVDGGAEETARRVVLATGVVDDLPRIDGLNDLWGSGVFHCPYCHGFEVSDLPLAVLALTPDDVMLASEVAHFTDDLVLCTNGAVTLDDDQWGLLDRTGVTVRTERIERLEPDGGRLGRILFAEGAPLPRRALFVQCENRQASDLPAALGCRLLDDGAVEVDDMQRTSVPGVSAAGDLARHPSMTLPGSMVSLAAAAGTVAAVGIDQDLLKSDLDDALPADA